MSDDAYDPIQGEDPGLPPYQNCKDCRQGYARHVLNAAGVCPRCTMPAGETRPNPGLPENTAGRRG